MLIMIVKKYYCLALKAKILFVNEDVKYDRGYLSGEYLVVP